MPWTRCSCHSTRTCKCHGVKVLSGAVKMAEVEEATCKQEYGMAGSMMDNGDAKGQQKGEVEVEVEVASDAEVASDSEVEVEVEVEVEIQEKTKVKKR